MVTPQLMRHPLGGKDVKDTIIMASRKKTYPLKQMPTTFLASTRSDIQKKPDLLPPTNIKDQTFSRRSYWIDIIVNFSINLIATLIGVYIGLTWTLNADREKQAILDHKQVVEKAASDSIYNLKALTLIHKELLECQVGLTFRQDETRKNLNRYLRSHPLSNALWKAIVNGGGIERIKDLDLLDVISRAYKQVEYIMFLEETQMQRATPAGSTQFNNFYGNIRAADKEVEELPLAQKAVRVAIVQIEMRLHSK